MLQPYNLKKRPMSYNLKSETETRRVYVSSLTDTEIATKLLHVDKSGNKWWAFEDLLQIPFIRKKAGEKVSQLYGVGLTKTDIQVFIDKIKKIAKSADLERYEKIYSELLQMEEIMAETADPVKQSLALCAVYILGDDEQVDAFSTATAVNKMAKWEFDVPAQAFFLNWLTDGMNDYTKLYNNLTQIALKPDA